MCKSWSDTEPGLISLGNGMAEWMDGVAALGNGQVPAVAATAFRLLSEGL